MEALIILITGALNVACFYIGAKVGQTVSKGERLEMPKIDPTRPFRERAERKEAKAAQSRHDAILRNIDRYNGTSSGQEDIPNREVSRWI